MSVKVNMSCVIHRLQVLQGARTREGAGRGYQFRVFNPPGSKPLFLRADLVVWYFQKVKQTHINEDRCSR
jgi:hypothetical protein